MNVMLTLVWMCIAYVLYVQHGYDTWPFLVFNIGLVVILSLRGKSSPFPWIFLVGFVFGLNQYDATFTNWYSAFLEMVDPAWVVWIDPAQYDFKALSRQGIQFLYKLTGLYYLLNGALVWSVWGYTIPEVLLLIVCGFWLLGLLVALLSLDKISNVFSRHGDRMLSRFESAEDMGKVFYGVLKLVPGMTNSMRHHGWKAGLRVGVLPVAYLLAVYLWYLTFLVVLIFLLFMLFFWILGIDFDKQATTPAQ